MVTNIPEAEFGPVVSKVPAYPYRVVPPAQRTLGQKRAFGSADGWLDTILNAAYQPKDDLEESLHDNTSDSCDAVQVHYKVVGKDGTTKIRVIQTLYIIVVIVHPEHLPRRPGDKPAVIAAAQAKRMFNSPERLNFRFLKDHKDIAIGEQIVKPGKVPDWLDTIRWWLDGTGLGFAMMKNTGPGQALKTSRDFQPNQAWFNKYEQSRAR